MSDYPANQLAKANEEIDRMVETIATLRQLVIELAKACSGDDLLVTCPACEGRSPEECGVCEEEGVICPGLVPFAKWVAAHSWKEWCSAPPAPQTEEEWDQYMSAPWPIMPSTKEVSR